MTVILPFLSTAGEYRVFKSADGRELEAKLLRVSGEEVTIVRKADRREFDLNLSAFSAEDQTHIRDWDQMKKLSRDDALDVKIRRSTDQKERSSSISTKRETWEAGYVIDVTNETFAVLEDLEVHYHIFKFDEAVAATDGEQGEMERKSGSFKIKTLDRDQTVSRETERFTLSASKLRSGWSYTNGGSDRSKDELDGCWVRVYKNGSLVHEFALPSSVARNQRWEPTNKK